MSKLRFQLNERGIAGIYLMAMKMPAGDREMDVLADVLRLVWLEGVRVGMQHPNGDPMAINDELTHLADQLQRTCVPSPAPSGDAAP